MSDVHRLLLNVGSEISDVAAGLENLAGLTSGLVRGCDPSERGQALRELQATDLLIQKCLALAAVVRALGLGQSVDDALSEVTLADVADRLGGTSVPVPGSVATGDLVLFE